MQSMNLSGILDFQKAIAITVKDIFETVLGF